MLIYLIYISRIFSDSFEDSNYSTIIGGLIILAAFYIFFKKKYKPTFNDYSKPFVKFVIAFLLINFLWALVSVLRFGSVLLLENIYQLLRFAGIVAIIYLLSYYSSRKGLNLKKLVDLLTYIYIVISIISIISVLNGSVLRAQWPHSHPNTLGGSLVIFIVYNFLNLKRFNLFQISKIALLSLGLFTTRSLSSFFILFIALSIFLIKGRHKIVFISSLIILLFFIHILDFDTLIIERVNDISLNPDVLKAASIGYTQNSFEWRIYNWNMLIKEFLKEPLLGYGTLGWKIVNPVRDYTGGGFLPHNEFVGWLVQFGIIGSSVLLYFLFSMFVTYYNHIKLSNSKLVFPYIILPYILASVLGRSFVAPLTFYYLSLILFVESNTNNSIYLETNDKNH